MNPQFWAGKKVFLTGHTGFKGSWLSLWLQSLGAEVTGFALPCPNAPSLFELANVSEGMRSVTGDVRDLTDLTKALAASNSSIVFHMAAQSLVRESYAAPVNTYATNVMGTVNLLEAVRVCPSVKAVINVTTDKCYENKERYQGYAEDEPLGGFDPYSNSKACSELVTSAYRNSFFNTAHYAQHHVALASARAGNVIGGGDWAKSRLIPDILQALADRKSVAIRYPHSIRPWQHVLEPLNGYLALAERLFESGPQFSEAWNFGPNDEDAQPVSWIADKLCRMWGEGAQWHVENGEHPHEAGLLKLNTAKARSRLNWRPILNLDETLHLIIEWYQRYQQKESVQQICIDQISQYQARLNIFKS
jgi:CDP-glucose 4,6-dehydratase